MCINFIEGSGYSSGSHVSKKNLCKKPRSSEKKSKTLRGIEPKTPHTPSHQLIFIFNFYFFASELVSYIRHS